MSQAVIHGDTIYLAGQVADQAKGRSVGEQTRTSSPQSTGCSRRPAPTRRGSSATVYLSDIATFAEMNAEWDAWVPPGHTPARATVEAKLAAPAYAVEIACIAARA